MMFSRAKYLLDSSHEYDSSDMTDVVKVLSDGRTLVDSRKTYLQTDAQTGILT
jgi:hypothetical protein